MAAAGSSPPSPAPPRPLRIVIFPWLAFGHLLPQMKLAECLASRGHRVSFISTPGNLARLPPPAPRVDLVSLPLPRVDGLPDGAESTNTVPQGKLNLLFQAFDGLAAPFAKFLAAACADERRRPDWIVIDWVHHWAAAAATEHKVPLVMFHPNATAMVKDPATVVPRYESKQGEAQFHSDDGVMSIAQRFLFILERCELVAARSCMEWEPDFLPQVAPLLHKPVVPCGLLPPTPEGVNGEEENAAVRWLDAQPPGSVLYVALGSEAPLPMEEVRELALGLELARTRFLWALKKPGGIADDGGELLPAGFLERTRGQGLVTMGWVPQISILGHGGVGGFLTHCGPSSLMEGLLFGRPLVMLPFFGDQMPNARLMEGKKVGLQVPRDEDDGSFDRHGVASAVRSVMVDEETRSVYVANALKAQEIIADKELHERYIDDFVEQLRSQTYVPKKKLRSQTGDSVMAAPLVAPQAEA
ncbi:unnamed protein product [Urochloa decumbens]|uniref:Glycosyltransferase n=1 Tax=Urochloa decumbens TaxID=240449 RepID=A0ABC8XYZ5_9POAL